jgi:hypothetical protein
MSLAVKTFRYKFMTERNLTPSCPARAESKSKHGSALFRRNPYHPVTSEFTMLSPLYTVSEKNVENFHLLELVA